MAKRKPKSSKHPAKTTRVVEEQLENFPTEPATLTEPEGLGYYDLRTENGKLSKSPLKDLVLHNQEAYRHLLFLISSGVHPVVAGATIGIPPNTIRDWINRGRESSSGLFFNFWNDVTLAISKTVAEASIEVRTKSPDKWLASGSALEVFAPEELPVGAFQTGMPAPTNNTQNNINIVAPETIPILAEALLELRRFGISLDAPLLEPPPEDEDSSKSAKT